MAQEISEDLYATTVFEDGGNLVIDLTNIEEQKFEAIPKGLYHAEVDQVDYGMSKSSGKPMLTFIFAIDGEMHPDYAGRKLYFYASFSEKALAGTKTALLRIDPTIFSGPFKPQAVAENGVLLGKRVRIKVSHEDYNGEARARIQTILAPASGGVGAGSGDGFFQD